MSRIGKKSISIPKEVTVSKSGLEVTVKGGKGELKFGLHKDIEVKISDDKMTLECKSEEPLAKAMYGTTRAILRNMVEGVSKGFQKSLEIHGVGYKAALKGKMLVLNLGFSHEVNFSIPEDLEITMDEKLKNIIHIKGIDKQKIGEAAAQIRKFRKPEPYKGKGIRYLGENILRKAGKSAAK
ncbi:50S ribosomal protein L6 [Candidatus Peregrinibacteria bacterium RIFOXYB2_FULL_32_7]|nr:MAG: 50S ribosomal protein L6 [Candidatus Peregrinibacteria bacterium RIFOXYB2_FULL_32_7]